MTAPTRELLSASTRRGRDPIDDDAELAAVLPRDRAPGKQRADEDVADTQKADPGKRSRAADGTPPMSPAAALAFADWITGAGRIDRRPEAAIDDEPGALSAAFEFLAGARGGQPLPDELRRRLELELGASLDAVRLHTDDRAAAAAAALRARAFALGDDVYFAAGAYDPDTEAGQELIAHEVAHVAQQRRGAAGATSTARRVSRPDDAHEREAEAFAARFAAAARAPRPGDDPARIVEHARRQGRRIELPFVAELEERLGTSFDFVEAYTGPAVEQACQMLSAAAFAVQNLVMLADPSPKREVLLHELTHVVQMGKRRAPAKLALGTFTVSQRHDAAEVEARRGATAEVAASPTTIHRTEGTEGTEEPAAEASTAQQRIDYFKTRAPRETFTKTITVDGRTEVDCAFRQPGASGHRYRESSPEPWRLAQYAEILNAAPEELRASMSTYGSDLQQMLGAAESHRLARVTDRTYAFIHDGPYVAQVEDIRPVARLRATPLERFNAYRPAIDRLKQLGRITGFTWGSDFTEQTCPASPAEADAYLEAMETAIAAGYEAAGPTSWQLFYDEVMKTPLFPASQNAVVGAIFETLVRNTAGVELDAERPLFRSSRFDGNELRIGDASYSGVVIIDSKATANGLGTEAIAQCGDYAKITDPDDPIPGYFKSTPNIQRIFQAVAYTVPGQPIADRVWRQIKGVHPDPATLQRFRVTPSPSDLRKFLLQFNPTIELQAEDNGGSSYLFANPPSLIPGVTIRSAQIQADAAADRIVSGSVDLELDMGGAFTSDAVTKSVTPTEGEAPAARVENSFGNFRSTLDQLLGAVTVDARLIDGGVEATIQLAAGAARIPGFNLEAATLTARYTDAGLSVTGEVGLSHTSGKLSGRVAVAWGGNQWTLDGTATLQEGVIEGLSEVTLGVRYDGGRTTISCAQASYEKQLGAVTLTGTVNNLEYDVDAGAFSGSATLAADLGMFGNASADATIENNELTNATFSYDSPEFKYPPDSEAPGFRGSVGGTITYENGQISGAIRGTANVALPALQAIAGESGIGLAVDAQINPDGTYGGTVATTTPIQFGQHLEIPSLSCTIAPDGSMSGAFEIKVVKIKYLEEARVQCTVDATGVHIADASVSAAFGEQGTGNFWGTLTAGYSEAAGLSIGGEVNYGIKEGMIATGTLTYENETNAVSLEMTVSEIKLLDSTVSKQLFSATKQIPVFSVWGLGVYLDLGFDLGFDFGFDLGVRPTVGFEGLSLETFEFTRIQAELELLGNIYAQLTGTPRLGLGIFALSPSILRGGGGVRIPIVGRAEIRPTGTISLAYTPDGGVEGDATVGMAMTFGITGSVTPYAELSVLDGMFNPSWEGDALTSFEILPPKEIFNFTIDLAGDMSTQTPELPESNAAGEPRAPEATRVLPEEHAAPAEQSGPAASAQAEGPTAPVAETGDEGPFSLAALAPLLEALPGAATVKGILEKAGQAWDALAGAFGRVINAFRSFFANLADQIMEILEGFATQGLGYIPTLVRKIVGETVYEIIEPLVLYVSQTGEELLELFETNPPTDLGNLMPWVWQVVTRVFNLAAGSLGGFVDAVRQMMSNLGEVARRLVNQAVNDGWIGVKRHHYYIWNPFDNWDFMAAAEFKLTIPGVIDLGRQGPPGILLTPGAAVALGLYELLEEMGVPVTFQGWNDAVGDAYNDRWRGDGARG